MRPFILKVLDYVLLAILIGAVTLASCNKLSYAQSVHPHGESGFAASNHTSAQTAPKAAFLCVPFGYATSMVRLNGEAFAPASSLCDLSANPVQSNHPNFAVNGSASNHTGAH